MEEPRRSKSHFPSADPTDHLMAPQLPPEKRFKERCLSVFSSHSDIVELGKGVEDAEVYAVFSLDIPIFILCVRDERRESKGDRCYNPIHCILNSI